MIQIRHSVSREDVAFGVLRAEGIRVHQAPPAFDVRLASLLDARRTPLREDEEAVRRAARDMLRNGRYKPTGRGKPASEYLVRAAGQDGDAAGAAGDGAFPRINAPVDVCNYISLKHLLPVSLWDLDLAETEQFLFRLGEAGEEYVFNSGGQAIALEDLIVGCAMRNETAAPIVNPVKDSLATKTTDRTVRVAACIYTPLTAVPAERLAEICAEFATLLAGCGDGVETAYGVVLPGEACTI